jgi:NifU-like protein involved in Fe-S cluster formation
MNARGGAVLYTPEILALAVELANFPLDRAHTLRGEAHSRLCGSRVALSLDLNQSGEIEAIGAQVAACAIGQAGGAIFLRSALGQDATTIGAAAEEIEAWLAGGDTLPSWPGMKALAAARAFPGRHGAILLPWRAALAALSNPVAAN